MTDLADILRQRIARHGPLTVAAFMAEALGHPVHGYYTRQDPLGADGDFITAPEITQMYGELIGLWCAVVWQSMGRPAPVTLVELGPGRGTLLADLLRASTRVPEFCSALSLHLIENSPILRTRQKETLKTVKPARRPTWHKSLETVPSGPMLLVASEFFDALPIHQFVRKPDGWHERLVDMDDDGGFYFTLSPEITRPSVTPRTTNRDCIFEVCTAASKWVRTIAKRLVCDGGAALIIDYGHVMSAVGETLQAVRRHRYANILADPGKTDLTAHVDFEALVTSAEAEGARAFGPLEQGTFLERIGLGLRAERLAAAANPRQNKAILTDYRRLTSPDQMGTLFKALVIQHPELPEPPGFDER